MEVNSTFGPWLKQRRKALDLTQEALAEQAGCSPDMIRRVEAGRARPSSQLGIRLAAVLTPDLPLPGGTSAPVHFGSWLKQQRQARDLTAAALAAALGCTPDLIFRLETERRRPSREIALSLAALFAVPLLGSIRYPMIRNGPYPPP